MSELTVRVVYYAYIGTLSFVTLSRGAQGTAAGTGQCLELPGTAPGRPFGA